MLAGAALIWVSSLSTTQGKRPSLGLTGLMCGTHIMTLTAANSYAMTGTVSISVGVNIWPSVTSIAGPMLFGR